MGTGAWATDEAWEDDELRTDVERRDRLEERDRHYADLQPSGLIHLTCPRCGEERTTYSLRMIGAECPSCSQPMERAA
jgi:ribosomal protein S27E